jgi:hypothetical protein
MWNRSFLLRQYSPISIPNRVAARENDDSWSPEPSPDVAIARAAGWPSPGVARVWPSHVQLAGRHQAWPAHQRSGCSKPARARDCLHLRRHRTRADLRRRSHALRSIFGLLPQVATTCPSNATVGHSSAPTACPSHRCSAAWPSISGRSAGGSLPGATVRPPLLPRVVPEQSCVGQLWP